MTETKSLNCVAILMPGDMGHGCATVFRQRGMRVITCLNGRSQRTRALAEKAGLEDMPTLGDVMQQPILSCRSCRPNMQCSKHKKPPQR